MKELFDQISEECSKNVTKSYSTSFSLATKMLSSSIRQDIYNIYGFVRFADEIVDTFHSYNKKELFERFVVCCCSTGMFIQSIDWLGFRELDCRLINPRNRTLV